MKIHFNDENFSTEKIQETKIKFNQFLATLEKDASDNQLIKNPYYYIKKGNKNPYSQNNRSRNARDCYNKAIQLDPIHAANAYYNKAILWLR